MFYCPECAHERDWPETMSRSRGICEICDKMAVCNDQPSYLLPMPPVDVIG